MCRSVLGSELRARVRLCAVDKSYGNERHRVRIFLRVRVCVSVRVRV